MDEGYLIAHDLQDQSAQGESSNIDTTALYEASDTGR